MMHIVVASALAQYPSLKTSGFVSNEGVPVSLLVDPPLINGKYRAFGMLQSTGGEYNCDCKLKRAVWGKFVSSSVVKDRYAAFTDSHNSACNVLTYGYKWEQSDSFGLIIDPNDRTPEVPALLSAISKEGKDKSPPLFELGHNEHSQLLDKCSNIENIHNLCAVATTTQHCVSSDLLEGTNVTFQECCWIRDAGQTRPALTGQSFKSRITTPCIANGECVPRTLGLQKDTVYAFSHGEASWLPSFPALSTQDVQFCVLNVDIIAARFTFVATGDAIEIYGNAGRYPGSCLKPQLFTKNAVTPPNMLSKNNGSVHYCDSAFPNMPTPFNSLNDNNAFVFCHNDLHLPNERRDICKLQGGSEILMGQRLKYRERVEQACNMLDRVCVLIPGDTFSSVATILSTGLDATDFTFVYLNVHMDVLQLLVIDPVVMDLIYDTNPETSPMYDTLVAPQKSMLLELLPRLDNSLGRAFCQNAPMDQHVFDMLHAALESNRNADGSYTFMADNISPTATTTVTSAYATFKETTTIEYSGVTIKSAFENVPAQIEPIECNTFFVTSSRFNAHNVIFNQTRCAYEEAYNRVPIVVAGEQGERTLVSNVTVVNAESPVMFLAGKTAKTRWVRTKHINITDSLVENVQFVYDNDYKGQMFFTALMGGTSGSAVVKGANTGYIMDIDTSLTPQTTCNDRNVCYKPNNTVSVNGIKIHDVSTCNQGCAIPVTTLNDGLSCAFVKNKGVHIPACSDYQPENINSSIVDSIGLGCAVVFPTDTRVGCADRARVPHCNDIVGSIKCVRYYDKHFRTCENSGGETCTAGSSCNGKTAQATSTPDGTDLSLRKDVLHDGPPFRQQWFFHQNEFGKSVLCSSKSPYMNTGCVGGCADFNIRCSPNVCPRVNEHRFLCVAPPEDINAVASLTEPALAHTFTLNVYNTIAIVQLKFNTACLTRMGATLQWTECTDGYKAQEWLVNKLDGINTYQLSIPESAYDCVTDRNNAGLVVAPCFPCNVGVGSTQYTFAENDVFVVTQDGIPEGYVGVPVSRTQYVAVYKENPSMCLTAQSSSALCGSVASWKLAYNAYVDATGIGLLMTGKAALKNGLSAVQCLHDCFGSNVEVTSANGKAARVNCDGQFCFATHKGTNYAYGETVSLTSGKVLGSAITEAALMQGSPNFSYSAVGVEAIDLTTLLDTFGVPYEHEVYHRLPANSALIWSGVISLWIAAGVGVITCVTAYLL